MGLLKSLLNVLSDTVEAAVKQASQQGQQSQGQEPQRPSFIPRQQEPEEPVSATADLSPAAQVAYFRDILHSDFPLYVVRENVPVTDIAGYAADEFKLYDTRPYQVYKAEWGQPYTFALYQGAALKGVVMLGDGHSHDQNVKYLIARKYAQKAGVPYINFYTQMQNERSYVVSRIRKFLEA